MSHGESSDWNQSRNIKKILQDKTGNCNQKYRHCQHECCLEKKIVVLKDHCEGFSDDRMTIKRTRGLRDVEINTEC